MTKPRNQVSRPTRSPEPPAARSPRWAVLAPLALGVTAVVAYHNSLTGKFIFDDFSNVQNNYKLRSLWPLWETMWGPLGAGVSGRPVVQISFALDYAVHGLDVRGYHVVNLLLHLATSLVLYAVMRRTLALPAFASRIGGPPPLFALLIAMVWQVHPLVTDSVTYISGRTEILGALFMLLTLYSAIRGVPSSRFPRLWQAAAVVFCVIGTGCKEILAAAPLLVLLYDRLFLSDSYRRALVGRRAMYVGLFASLVFIPLNLYMADFHRSALVTSDKLNAWDYLKTQSEVLVLYLRLSFWPHPLIIDYQGWPTHPTLVSVLPYALLVVVLLAATAVGIARRAPAAYAGAWCFLILAPTSSVLPLPTEVATERRMYLPLMGIVALVLVAGWRGLQRAGRRFSVAPGTLRSVGGGLVAAVVVAGTVRTLARNEEYKDALALWADVAARRPGNSRALDNLGFEFIGRGDLATAKRLFQKAVEVNPGDFVAYNNLGNMFIREGNDEEAIRHLESAIKIKPDYAVAYQNLGVVYFNRGRFAEAESALRYAVRLQPTRLDNLVNLARVLAAQDKLAEAEQVARRAVRLDSNSAAAHHRLGATLARANRGPEAVYELRTAHQLAPGDREYRAHLAWHLAALDGPETRNPKEAIALATRAVEESGGRDFVALDTLALAQAADGQFTLAAATAERALEGARARQSPRTGPMEARRDAYVAGQMPSAELRQFGE